GGGQEVGGRAGGRLGGRGLGWVRGRGRLQRWLRRLRRRWWLLGWRRGREILTMATMTLEQFTAAVAAALGDRLVALVLYGSAARGTHVPGRSDMNTLLICEAVDEALFARLEPAVRGWGRSGHPATLIPTAREWRPPAAGVPI